MDDGFFAVIPARFASTRLPGKPLVDLGGRPMVVRVAERARDAGARVVVATDHAEIARVVRKAGFEAELTAVEHPSGSDRVMEVAARRQWPDETIVINVQGDEPLIPPEVIAQLADALRADAALEAVTLCEPLLDPAARGDANVVKVVRGVDGCALYFSRAPIPHVRDETPPGVQPWYRHVGVYGYRLRTLARFVALAPSPLEELERLEQLRLLENRIPLKVLDACAAVPGGVDTAADVTRVRTLLARP